MKPVEGSISLRGKLVDKPGPDRMMVFQEFDQLLPWKTVAENVMFPMQVSKRVGRGEIADRANRYTELFRGAAILGPAGFESRGPHGLARGDGRRRNPFRAQRERPAFQPPAAVREATDARPSLVGLSLKTEMGGPRKARKDTKKRVLYHLSEITGRRLRRCSRGH